MWVLTNGLNYQNTKAWWLVFFVFSRFNLKNFRKKQGVHICSYNKTNQRYDFIGFKTKEFKCHGSLQQIMLFSVEGVYGTDCDVTDGSHLVIFLKKNSVYSQELRATRKILEDQKRSGEKLANQPIIRTL